MSIATWSHARDAAPPCGERVDAPAAVNAKPGECARLAIPTSREPRRGSHATPPAVRRRSAAAAAGRGGNGDFAAPGLEDRRPLRQRVREDVAAPRPALLVRGSGRRRSLCRDAAGEEENNNNADNLRPPMNYQSEISKYLLSNNYYRNR